MNKSVVFVILALSAILVFSACSADVVGKVAVSSFEEIQGKAQVSKAGNQTSITSPTGNIFEYGPNGTAMKFPIAPFVAAGLNAKKLPGYLVIENDMLVIRQDYKANDFSSFVEKYRDKVGYHEALDHYGIDMGNGNKFEWAKDLNKNDKDVVFVLNPEPFKDAGVNVESVEGFAYAEVEMGKDVKEFKLLAPYDLNNQTAQTSAVAQADVATSGNVTESTPAASETAKSTPAPAAAAQTPAAAATPGQTTKAETKFDGIVINKKDVTTTAKFIPYTADGVKMEVFAVKASDGSIRTAFNTCQVCYDSGRGYYIQKGDVFVCQNCGNQFRTIDIEKIKGGCNPVPITNDIKTEDETSIKISSNILAEAKDLFSEWKR